MKKQQLKLEQELTNEELALHFSIEISLLYIKQKKLLEEILYTEKKLNEFNDMLCSEDSLKQLNNFNKLSEFYCESMELYLLQKKAIKDLDKDLKEINRIIFEIKHKDLPF
jgi:hypothetical protein